MLSGHMAREYRPTKQQLAFAQAYNAQPMDDKSPKRAAIEAGYSPRTAAEQARRLMNHHEVRRHIMRADPRQVQEIANINAAWVLHELASLWSVNLAELFTEDGNLKPIHEISPKAQKLLAGFEVTELTEYDEDGKPFTTTRTGKIKTINPLAILEDIGKLAKVGAFKSESEDNLNDSLADLIRAQTNALDRAASARDITPESRRIQNGTGSKDGGTSSDAEWEAAGR